MKVLLDKWRNYIETVYGLTIHDSWELYAPDYQIMADSLEKALLKLKTAYNLSISDKGTVDMVIIYTDNLLKVEGMYKDLITSKFETLSITILDHFEVREIGKWKNLINAQEIAQYGQYLMDNLFKPNKYCYITPNQVPRKAIKQAQKKAKDLTAAYIFPTDFIKYSQMRKALFGGICYVPYKNLIIDEPIMCLDLTSAYIYDLLIEKHCVTAFERTNPEDYEYYMQSKTKSAYGYFTITYSGYSNKITCFRDIEGNKFETGVHTIDVIMNTIDLTTFSELADIQEIKCEWLYECNIDHLPKYMLDETVKQYIKKVALKEDKEAYDLQKPIVNGIYGDTIRDYDEEAFNHARRNSAVVPQWGIWTTSYAKKNLLKLATKVEGWMYSDTDSIYCYDNDFNRALLNDYNRRATMKVKEFCEEFGYDYEKLKDLGTFKIEKKIKRFRAITQKVYMYETTDGEFKLTAAGLNQSTIAVDKSLFDKRKLDYGQRLYKWVDDDGYHEEWKGTLESVIQSTCINEQY